MTATILKFPGFLLTNDGRGFWKDGKYHANVDALMASLNPREQVRTLNWNSRRFPERVRERERDSGGSAA